MGYIKESERYQIEILLKEKYTIKQISNILGHKYHTIYSEIKRGTVKQLGAELKELYIYKADYAQKVYMDNVSNRGRNLKIGNDMDFLLYLEKMIKEEHYSPEAILNHIKNNKIKFKTQICFKTIYNYLDMGLFLNIDNTDLPCKKGNRIKEKKHIKRSMHNLRGDSIEKRPEHIKDRIEYGHWEMDTVYSAKGQGRSCLLVLSERKTRKELIFKMPDRTSKSVIHVLDCFERRIGIKKFIENFKTITCDNGVEFSNFEKIERSIKNGKRTKVYYCHSYSSWERGTNENINRMIRRIYPKGTGFDSVTNKSVKKLQDWINNYPRKIFGGLSSIQFCNANGIANI